MPFPNSSNESSSNTKKSSWFTSWFENDNVNFKEQIHDKLNQFDNYQHQHERRNPFAAAAAAAALATREHRPPTSLQQEMEEFFEAAGFGGLAHHSTPIRSQYHLRHQETPSGVQLDVQFPQEPKNLAVEVLQEYPCVVQWRNGNDFQDRARLGDSIDCSRISASLAKNTLTVQAPRMTMSEKFSKPRTVIVTERDE